MTDKGPFHAMGGIKYITSGDAFKDQQVTKLSAMPVSYTHLDVYKRQG